MQSKGIYVAPRVGNIDVLEEKQKQNKNPTRLLHVSAEVNLTRYILINVHHNVSILVVSVDFLCQQLAARGSVLTSLR